MAKMLVCDDVQQYYLSVQGLSEPPMETRKAPVERKGSFRAHMTSRLVISC